MTAPANDTLDTRNLTDMELKPSTAAGLPQGREHPVLVVLDSRRTSRRYEIKRQCFTAGRDESCDIVLHDSNCSRKHAQLEFLNFDDAQSKPRITLTDLESRNGTYVNGVKVSTVELKSGDKILLGQTLVGYYLWDDATLRAENSLLRNASTDAMTGLYNRGFFQSTLQREFHRALRYQRALSLVFIDLDHFKSVNDSYGHPIGDKVLIEVSGVVLANTRTNDFACRYGGEEILVILPETPLDSAMIYTTRLRQKINALDIPVGAATLHVTASFGVAAIQPGMREPEDLLKHADNACYRAKRDGRDRICSAAGEENELEQTQPLAQLAKG